MENKKEETTTCDRGHEPITFTGSFWVLCPLCAQIEKTASAEAEGERCVDFNQAERDKHIERLEGKLAAVREELEAADNATAAAEGMVKSREEEKVELLAEIAELKRKK